ncbi:MAG: LysM peptidoglycan-binding domain-containing protein [Desulfobulbaceae bacterium]|nr:LysM peptidoglycan-binding domain-containing protein [Desulfobulbaceae bacterium]HIJ78030.1 LysM peptidoglycan-binding domain-containing protein [Deltaproteobacteria bacterium]
MKKAVATALLLAFACVGAGSQDVQAENVTTHEVQKGDTLWGLSNGYLKDPLLWPKIWKINPAIDNPHVIAPGQVVKIPLLDDKAETEMAPVSSGEIMAKPAPPAPPVPEIDMSSGPLAIKIVRDQGPKVEKAEKKIELDLYRIYDRGIGLVTYDMPGEGTILNTELGWSKTAVGGIILVNAPGAQVGQKFGVYRDLGEVKPLAYGQKSVGRLRADIAVLEIITSDAIKQQAVITRAFTEVKAGDLLGAVPELPNIKVNDSRGNYVSVNGRVVAVHLMRSLAAADDIVYLDLGSNDGLQPGSRLHIKSAAETDNRRPSAEALVLRVGPTTAAAIVSSASSHEIRPGDVVEARF